MPPLISVITPTWNRASVLTGRCIPSVQAQTYPVIEHVIVSDGPDYALAPVMRQRWPDVIFDWLPEHDPSVRWGIRARLRALDLAHGDIIVNLDDDDILRPHCCEKLAAALAGPGVDFAFGQVFKHADLIPGYVWCSGAFTPGGIPTTGLAFWEDTPAWFGGAWLPADPTTDWPMVMRWIQAGAKGAFVPDVLTEAI